MTAYKEYDFPSVDGPIRTHVTRRIRDEEMHMEVYGDGYGT